MFQPDDLNMRRYYRLASLRPFLGGQIRGTQGSGERVRHSTLLDAANEDRHPEAVNFEGSSRLAVVAASKTADHQ